MADQPPHALAGWVEALRRPFAYPHSVDAVTVIQTHVSYVLLAGAFAYKLKKPVDFGFLDFRSLERRRHFCQREVELNGRLARGLYLGVVPIWRAADGLSVGAEPWRGGPFPPDLVEFAVKMRRLPAASMMDARLAEGTLPPNAIEELARRMARFHQEVPCGPGVARFGSPTELARSWAENFAQTRPLVGVTHSGAQRRLLGEYVQASLIRRRAQLRDRVRAGRIREGHGDLRTSAVCFDASCPEGICIFDCIEFNRRFRCCDVASETAFLAMDLTLQGWPELAERYVDAYVAASGDGGVRPLLPFYGCYRAFVRGKVEGFRFEEPEVGARDRALSLAVARRAFALACRYAEEDRPPLLILMSGLSGTGKTTLGAALGKRLGMRVISSDAVRRERPGARPAEPEGFGEGRYSLDRRQAVYGELRRRAGAALASGESVLLDATFASRAHRVWLGALAQEVGAYLFFLECRAPDEVVRARLARREREGSDSDARLQVYLRQKDLFEPLKEVDPWRHLIVDTSTSIEESARGALSALELRLRPGGVRGALAQPAAASAATP